MAKRDYDPWELDPGLPDDFDFWITSAEFGFLPEYVDAQGSPQPLLLWWGESPDGDFEGPIPWSLGKGWEPSKDRTRVTNPSKKKQTFVATSMYGRLIRRMQDLKVLDVLKRRGDPTEAHVWVGLGFHMRREEIEYPGLLGDRGGKTSRLMPVSFLGERGAGEHPHPPREEVEEDKGEAAPPPDREKVIKKLAALARAKDREEFERVAMDMEEVVSDDDLLADVLDGSEGGFWSRARRGEVR